ncbi:hypothetical protein NVP1248O_60 [Vibrio phage 1.248.O._10N.261.54.F1]|nr:hypothetical protein NVP1248O_60 [Vibrio phage 1.248.O._10N.261.54.F1]
MADVTLAMQAKSDQLNATDIMGVEPIITIRDVKVNAGAQSQKVWIYYHGDNNRPWKPSVGMTRIIAAGWGTNSDNWIGKSVQIFMEPSVIYAGKEVGGIRIRAMSDIPKRGLNATITISRTKREPYPVKFLSMDRPAYPADTFEKGFAAMVDMMESKKMTLEQIIARCQQTGELTEEQFKRLSDAAPVEGDGDEQQPEPPQEIEEF